MNTQEWLSGIQDRAGPLVEPALRAVHISGGSAPFPRGSVGLEIVRDALSLQVESETATDEDDRKWVQDFGALFGLLLVDALGGCGHVEKDGEHRIGVGAHGACDPFTALEFALDHEEPRIEFVRQVELAEAEAAGQGPVSRVVSEFAQTLARLRPDLGIEGQFELHLSLGSDVSVDLARVAQTTAEASASSLTLACEKVISMLPGGDERGVNIPWSEAAERLMPRVVGEAFLAELGPERRAAVFQMPLVRGLYLALQLEYSGRSRFLRNDEVEHWTLPGLEVVQRALNNLATRSQRARFIKERSEGRTMVLAQSRDGWDASRLVLPGLYDVLVEHLTPPFAVCAPHRDELLACSLEDADSLAALRLKAFDDAARAPHTVSSDIFLLSEDGLAPLPVRPVS